MGLFDLLRYGRTGRPDFLSGVPTQLGMKSPWQEGSLTAMVASDLIGKEIFSALPMGRDEAIKIPAVSKARNLLVSSIARFPLRALDETGLLATQPTWLYRTNGPVSPYERMAWTVDDLVFYGASLWLTERGAAGQILDARWCPPSQWNVTDGHILVNDEDVKEDEFLLFNAPFEGLLNVGDRTLKGARDTEDAWTGRMRNPIPLIELKVTDDANLGQTEVREFLDKWAAARRAVNGGVSFTPPGMEVITHGEVHADLFVEARNAIRTDVASFLNLTAAIIDGTIGVDSLTYSTKEGEVAIFQAIGLPFWTDPIEATLSQDKCVARGQRIRFDRTDANNNLPLGINTED
jgi:hypothetical protein